MAERGLSVQAIVHFLPIGFKLFFYRVFSIYFLSEMYLGIYKTHLCNGVYYLARHNCCEQITRNFVSFSNF